MNVLEFVVRMKDEATAKLQALRSSVRGTGADSRKTVPELGEMGNKMAEVTGGFSRAREALMKMVGMGSLIAGTFTAAYRAALPLGEYIRRMWDPVERGADNFRRMEAQIEKTAAATQKKMEAQRAAVQAIADAYEKAIAASGRYFDNARRASAVEKASLSPDEAELNMREASAAYGISHSRIADLQGRLAAAHREQAENAQKYPRQMKPEQLQDFLSSNAVFKKAIGLIEKQLSAAMEDAGQASFDVRAAYAEYDQARVNAAREDVKRQNGEIADAKREETGALDQRREKTLRRLEAETDLAARAWEEYKDPSKRQARLESEAAEKQQKDQFAQDKQDFINKYGIEIWGKKTFDESRLGQSARDAMTDREKSVMDVMKAQDKQASGETLLKEIAAATKKTADQLDQALRVK